MSRRIDTTEVASSIPFDNDGTTLISDNVQDAIEEARIGGVGTVVSLQFWTSGNTADKWLGYASSTAPSDEIPFVAPQNMALKGIIFVNRDNDVDVNIKIYKNGTLIYTENIRNKRWSYDVGIPGGPLFSQGDRVSVFLEKYTGGTGDSTAQDPLVILYCKFVAEAGGSGGAQSGVT